MGLIMESSLPQKTPEQITKMTQANAMAAIVPQIMNAIGGGDRRTQEALQKQSQQNDSRMEKQRLQMFMRSIMSPDSGEITPELITQQAQLFNVPALEAMKGVLSLQKFTKDKAKDKSDQNATAIGKHILASEDPAMTRQNYLSGALPMFGENFGNNAIMQGVKTADSMLPKPEKAEMFKSFSPDGSFTWNKKELGASGLPQPDDRSFGWVGQVDGSKKYGELTPGTVSQAAPKSGMEIISKDGTVIRTGVNTNQSVPTRTTKSKTQNTLIEANETYANLKSTINKYDDSFLMGKDKIGFAMDAFKEKWEIGSVSEDEKQKLSDYSTFKQESISTLNDYIKQITGAAMSAEEAKRLMKGMPNPGVGLFDGDSPTQFKSKMNGVMQKIDRTIARSNYVLRHGLKSFEDVPLGSMDRIIDSRGEQIEKELKTQYPDMDEAEIIKMTSETLSKEFGIRF